MTVPIVDQQAALERAWERRAWIVEDEPAVATLAAEMCEARGATTSVFPLSLPFLTALRTDSPPAVIVLDWRLEHELSAALFMGVRYRYPRLPIIYWTGSNTESLPSMILGDPCTLVVDKASGASSFEEALSWALDDQPDAAMEPLPAV